ncbi:MAG TPA: hypothetical protein VNY05_31310 [Candidatus Acidoferrales bacterium]|jgi:hypothetical protein|nr:hypothetical protein [Candidatus Acidoferrales bacterium]
MQSYILACCFCAFGLAAQANSAQFEGGSRNTCYGIESVSGTQGFPGALQDHALLAAALPETGTKVLFGTGFALIALGRIRQRSGARVRRK